MIMIISMRMLRSRMRKLVPSIDARREGEGRYFGEDTHRRNIIRNLDTSLEKSQMFIVSRKSKLKIPWSLSTERYEACTEADEGNQVLGYNNCSPIF